MKIITKYLLITLLVFLVNSATRSPGELKAKKLYDLSYKFTDGVIDFKNAQEYFHFVEESPRPYIIVLVLDAKDCDICEKLLKVMGKVSRTYSNNGASDLSGKEIPTFFIRI